MTTANDEFSLDVFPLFPVGDCGNISWGRREHLCNFFDRYFDLTEFSNFSNIAVREFGKGVIGSMLGIFSSGVSDVPAPRFHIFKILGLGSDKKMGRPNTSGLVTSVPNRFSFRDCATVKQLPGKSVGGHRVIAGLEPTVSATVCVPGPNPASSFHVRLLRAALVYLFPESRDRVSFWPSHGVPPFSLTIESPNGGMVK